MKHDILEGHIEAGFYMNPKTVFYKLFLGNREHTSLLGCNYSCYKEDMLNINGIDESYGPSPVADDTDIEWRFRKLGIKIKSCKFAANIFHLYHKRKNIHREFPIGSELTVMNFRKEKGSYKALIGLDSHKI